MVNEQENAMTGHELIELIQNNSNLDAEFYVMDSNGNAVAIKCVEGFIRRDPFDSDFDRSANAIVLHDNCMIVE
jgi:hypothetical protein